MSPPITPPTDLTAATPGPAPIIQLKNLKAGYGDLVVLRDVSMDVFPAEIRVILGGSGCGKSTLLKNIIGLEIPLGGEISILGRTVDWSKDGLPVEGMQKIGVLFQNSGLLTSLTVGENVALPLRIHSPWLPEGIIREIVRHKLEQVRMGHAFDKTPNELSGGMRKRAGLARAMVTDPPLLFCDEPSAGLDPVTSRSLDELLLELRQDLGITIVVVTHELDSIQTIADNITFLAGGEVIYDGPFADAQESGPPAVRAFLMRQEEGASPTNGRSRERED